VKESAMSIATTFLRRCIATLELAP